LDIEVTDEVLVLGDVLDNLFDTTWNLVVAPIEELVVEDVGAKGNSLGEFEVSVQVALAGLVAFLCYHVLDDVIALADLEEVVLLGKVTALREGHEPRLGTIGVIAFAEHGA